MNHRTDDLGAALDANPPDIVLDCVGGSEFGALFTKMAMRGRWIQIAALGGARSEISLDTVFRKNLRLIGSTLRSRTNEMKREVLRSLEREYWPRWGCLLRWFWVLFSGRAPLPASRLKGGLPSSAGRVRG